VAVTKGSDVALKPDSVVRLGDVLTIEFLPDPSFGTDNDDSDATGFQAIE